MFLLNLSANDAPAGSFLKMFPDSSVVKTGKISAPLSKRWMSSGMVWRGEYWMQNILEHPNVVVVYSLSQAIDQSAPLKYFLTIAELQSLLQRAKARKKTLPTDLENALQTQISILSRMPLLEECIHLARKQGDTAAMEKLGHLTPEGELMLYARRLMPSEYERLQGFPEGWTEIDTKV